MMTQYIHETTVQEATADIATPEPAHAIDPRPAARVREVRRPRRTPTCVTLQKHARRTAQRHLVGIDQCRTLRKSNLLVRDHWRALVTALEEVRQGEELRVRRGRADYYFEMRDTVLEVCGMPPESHVRYWVETPAGFQFWVPKALCSEPVVPDNG
jgi:hypothetical protein